MKPRSEKPCDNGNSLAEALSSCKPIYILPRDDVANEVISPAMASSAEVSVMIGFFSSAAFREIAPGLAAFLKESNETMRLVISPFISETDQGALREGILNASSLADKAVEALIPNADDLANHTLSCLAWLISAGRLSVRIALMKDALFHSKVWLFKNAGACAAFHGSANMTGSGLRRNREQLSLARSWMSTEAQDTFVELSGEFETLWTGGDDHCLTIRLSDAVASRILQDFKGEKQPTEDDFRRLWRRAHGLSDEPINLDIIPAKENRKNFSIPSWLEFRTGEYAHQGQAIDAWNGQGHRGILEMCTGSGKTLTALAAAQLLHEETGPLLIVISAPYNVLVSQWCSEVSHFGLRPINMTEASGRADRARKLADARRRLRKGSSPSEAIVVSNDTLCTSDFQDELRKFDGKKLLIADECHNLGAPNFISNPPEFFDYRLGLSATPVRQYDEEGTDRLFAYFGDPCFSYTLEEAIGTCLTPYEYHVTFVELNSSEMAEWREISDKISRLAWKIEAGKSDVYLESLFLRRRRILETANAKIEMLNELLKQFGPRNLEYTLIYATDKDPGQLQNVNRLLNSYGILFHQLTAEETSRPAKSKAILDRFQSGDLKVLTAKRVLDEGVNVPQIMRAYILASTTVRRQWVQRRGRLLRTCKEIGKQFAIIHDLVTLSPRVAVGGALDDDAKKIVNSELDRVWEFARLSKNAAVIGGPLEAVEKMRKLVEG